MISYRRYIVYKDISTSITQKCSLVFFISYQKGQTVTAGFKCFNFIQKLNIIVLIQKNRIIALAERVENQP